MYTVAAVFAFILTPILWILYHKIFGVIYFGGVGRGIIKELLSCFFVSLIIVSLVVACGGAALGAAGSVFGWLIKVIFFLLKWVLIIAAIGGVIYLVNTKILKKDTADSSHAESDADTTENISPPAVDNTVKENNMTEEQTSKSSCEQPTIVADQPEVQEDTEVQEDIEAQEDIAAYIREHFKGQKVKAIKYYSEQTGVDLRTAKKFVEKIQIENDSRFCPYCGKELNKKVKFCNFCGKEIK